MIAHGIDLDSEGIRAFCKKWKIKELCVFGSILRDDFRPDSDIDFLVRFEELDEEDEWDLFDVIHMQEELEGIVGRKVDFVDRSGIEENSNRFLRDGVLSNVEPVYAQGRYRLPDTDRPNRRLCRCCCFIRRHAEC